MEFHHISVMLEETVKGLVTNKEGTYVDCTLGGAGHSRRIAELLEPAGRIIGIDQDEEAIAAARVRLSDVRCRVDIVHSNFRNLESILESEQAPLVDGVVFDLGVSSHQLDKSARGFSYKTEAPLDMRMDQSAGLSAKDVVNAYPEAELARIFFEYGEERFSRRIAEKICRAREQYPIETTIQLAQIVREAIPGKYRNEPQHPARRTFQALRIEVNSELAGLDQAVEQACDLLQKGGRLCIITFHSLEDRIVKQAFRRFENPCTCPPSAPICICGKTPKAKILTKKPLTASAEEEAQNSRSTSAKLRCIEKI